MIATFHKINRGLGLAVFVFAGLTLVTLTDAQSGGNAAASNSLQPARIPRHSSSRSGSTNVGAASFFRTRNQGGKLVGSFLSDYPDQLKESLAKVPGLKVTSVEQITPKALLQYEESRQDSL